MSRLLRRMRSGRGMTDDRCEDHAIRADAVPGETPVIHFQAFTINPVPVGWDIRTSAMFSTNAMG
jgi:hypothetical protein